jgi:signal transduction histidine kinase
MSLERRVGPSEPGALVQAGPIGIGTVDESGRIVACDSEFARLLGVADPAALDGRSLEEIAPSGEDDWRDLLASARARAGLTARTVRIGPPALNRALDVVSWADTTPEGRSGYRVLVSPADPSRTNPDAASIAERARVARELHDGLAQDLWIAKLAASKLLRHESLDDDARAICTDLLRSIDSGLTEARSAVMAMRPASNRPMTLGGLVRQQVDEFSDRFGIRTECRIEGEPVVPAHVSVEVLRILQEALTNVRKHAHAGRVVVQLLERRSSTLLTVRDDGVGFNPTTTTCGYGRESMAERAEAIRGRLIVASGPGRGTSVSLRLPVDAVVGR